MSVIRNNLLLTDDGYNISRSVRLRKSATAYFNRTFSTPTNNKIWTWSGWVKRGQLGVAQAIIGTTDNNTASGNFGVIRFNASDYLEYFEYATGYTLQISSNGVYRDPSAWYHIVIAIDTTQATAANRTKFYVNGTAVSMSLTTSPSQNYNTYINSAVATYQGAYNNSGTGIQTPFDGYMTEINLIDGQALTPSSFGETDSITGVWKPKKYTGTYGTNGFFLNFSDNSSNTATTIGKDYSGNGNNWTPNNISVTSGVTYDSMLDVPTMWADGGNGRGNYCTLNPVFKNANTTYGVMATPSDGNLNATMGAGTNVYSTMALPTSGKYYVECEAVSFTSQLNIGFMSDDGNANRSAWWNNANGIYVDNAQQFAGATSTGVIAMAIDCDAKTVQFYRDNGARGSAYTYSTGSVSAHLLWAYTNSGATVRWNFGQRPFAYTPPTGFKALNTQNLPDATIKKGNQFFDATTYTGTGATLSVTNSGSMQPDLVWIKDRSAARSHRLFDAVRGATKGLFSDATDAETTLATDLTAFNSNGFTLGVGLGSNASTETFVGWQWKESASAGFDIVTYTGTGVARTVSHSLGVAPAMMIIKNRTSAVDWLVYHTSLGNTNYAVLNTTAAAATNAAAWNNTSPTSSVFTVGTGTSVNQNTNSHVAYLFAEVAGYSKFGSYTGNGSTDGPFVFTGFRPRWVMIKLTSSAGAGWAIYDTSRDIYNAMNNLLAANTSGAEVSPYPIDCLSNGFKIRNIDGAMNASSSTYIYAAFAENPFKNSLAR